MNILEHLLTVNPMSRPAFGINSIKKIVVHYVGNPNSTAIANRNYFENLKSQNKTYGSSHYIIGLDGEIMRCIPENEVAWHAGNLEMNYNSIGIECCHPDTTGKFNDKTYNSLLELLKDLCTRYNLNPMIDIIRHYDVTRKKCPLYYVNNQNEWDKLKQNVAIDFEEVEDTEMLEQLRNEVQALRNEVQELKNFIKGGNTVVNNAQRYTVTAQGVNVRQSPNLFAKVVKLYNVGQHTFEILEDNGSWIRCNEGWIKKVFVKKV